MKIKKFIVAVSTVAISAMTLAVFGSLNAYADKKDSYEFYLAGQYGTHGGFWSSNENGNAPVTVTQDDTEYTLKVTGEGGQVTADDLILFIQSDANVFDYGNSGVDGDTGIKNGSINIVVSSIKVDGQPVSYTASSNALNVGNNEADLRLNIYNKHQKPDEVCDIDPNFTVSSSIEVTFKTSGLFSATETDDSATVSTDAPSSETTAVTTVATESTTNAVAVSNSSANSLTSSNNVSVNAGVTAGDSATADTGTNADTGDSTNAVAIVMLAIASSGAILCSKKRK